jgi:hypothetical protein
LTIRSLSRRLLGLDSLRWDATAPWRAARVTIGVVVPLILGWISGHVDYGAYAALGALPAGFASFQGETVSRVVVVAVASIGMAVSTLVGATTAAMAPWLLVPVVALWGYVAGLAICLGQRASVAVLQWSVALLIAVGLPFGASDAALRAALVLAGGGLQVALIAGAWTLRPGTRERKALAASYRALALYASGLAEGRPATPAPTAFPAHSALEDPNPLVPEPVRLTLVDLLEEADRIRASLAALATHAAEGGASEKAPVRHFAAEAAAALNLIAATLDAGQAGQLDLNERIGALAVPADAAWRWAGESLLGQLRAVARIVTNLEAAPGTASHGTGIARSAGHGQGTAAAAFALLRANIGISSEAGRHALRLALIATLAEVVVQAAGLYQGRWVVLTIFLVLRPDYGSTLNRGVQRAIGTALGVLLGALAAGLAQAAQGGLVAVAAVSVAAAYALFDVSYLLFSVFITSFVVVLLELLGIPAIRTAEARVFATLIGSSLALVAYFVWPTWEGFTAQEKFARLLEAHRDYGQALLRELAQPGGCDPAQLRALQRVARRARSDAEAGAARLSEEPEHPPLTSDVARALIAAVARLARAELALHALALSPQRPVRAPDPMDSATARLDDLNAAVVTAMSRIAFALRNLQPPQPIPALRPIHAALRAATPSRDAALVTVTDQLVDAINTLDAIARTRLTPEAVRPPQPVI